MIDTDRYSMTLEWDPDDKIYVVTVPELPGCRTHGETREIAIQNGQDAIESWLDAARASNQEIPRPREFSHR